MNHLKHAGLKYPAAERRWRQRIIVSACGTEGIGLNPRKPDSNGSTLVNQVLLRLSTTWKDFDNSYCNNYIRPMRSLVSYRGKDFIGVEELAKVASSLVERYRGEPERGNVRLMITQRIVRHYMAEDLLGDPSGQSGTSIVFNYGNLLRLLAVKKLLADNWSVVKIREFMRALDITALEQLINSAFSRSTKPNQQQRQDESTARGQARNLRGAQRRSEEEPKPESPPFVSSHNTQTQTPPLASLVVASARRAESRGSEWIEIATGLEIKVRRSFQPPSTQQERERILARFWAVVGAKRKE